MGKVVEIGNQELKERRRQVMLGVMAMALVDEWTECGVFELDGVTEAITPVIDETLDRILEEGVDILEIEENVNEMRERMIEFMKETIEEDEK